MSKLIKHGSRRVCEICGIQESRLTPRSRFFGAYPLDEVRCREWVRVTGKEDLVHVPIEKLNQSRWVCGEHFEKQDFNKQGNRLLMHAVPTRKLTSIPLNRDQMSEFPLHMFNNQASLNQSSYGHDVTNKTGSPLSEIKVSDEEDGEPAVHEDIICDNCSGNIISFRYKCVTCDNYDLCQKCERLELHSKHYMLRIPKSLRFEIAGNFIVKLREVLKSDQTILAPPKRTYEAVKTYKGRKTVKENVNNNDKDIVEVDLLENDKRRIRSEVERALQLAKIRKKNKVNRKRPTVVTNDSAPIKKQRTCKENEIIVQVHTVEDINNVAGEIIIEHAPEFVFDKRKTDFDENTENADVCSTHHQENQDNLQSFYLKTGVNLSHYTIQVVRNSEEPT